MTRRLICIMVLTAVHSAALTPYEEMVQRWRQKQERELKADDGWLTVAGLFWLKDGVNTAGSDAASDIVLPRGPAKIGQFDFHQGQTIFRPVTGVAVSVDGKPAGAAEKLKPDTAGKPDQVQLNGLTMFVIHRGERYAIRLRDIESKFRKEFTALRWFPVKPSYRVTAKFVAYEAPKLIAIPNVLGETSRQPSPGYVLFTLEGHAWRLDPVLEENHLFFIFHDQTSGKETYPPGRFLDADLPKEGKVVLDFNKAYNPPCAFTPYATCPLPPKQNRLAIPIEAGEQFSGAHAQSAGGASNPLNVTVVHFDATGTFEQVLRQLAIRLRPKAVIGFVKHSGPERGITISLKEATVGVVLGSMCSQDHRYKVVARGSTHVINIIPADNDNQRLMTLFHLNGSISPPMIGRRTSSCGYPSSCLRSKRILQRGMPRRAS